MKTDVRPAGLLFVLVVVLAVALAPATGLAQGTPPNTNGDRIQDRDRDQVQDCTLDAYDLTRLRDRDQDRDQDRDRLHLLSLAPPIEEGGGYIHRHRIQNQVQHNWNHFPGLMLLWIGPF